MLHRAQEPALHPCSQVILTQPSLAASAGLNSFQLAAIYYTPRRQPPPLCLQNIYACVSLPLLPPMPHTGPGTQWEQNDSGMNS